VYFLQLSFFKYSLWFSDRPELQECSAAPCDTGSHRSILEREYPNLDFSRLDEGWTSKEGQYGQSKLVLSNVNLMGTLLAPDEASLDRRATFMRRWLRDRPENQILVIAHGSFLRHLTFAPWSGKSLLHPLEFQVVTGIHS